MSPPPFSTSPASSTPVELSAAERAAIIKAQVANLKRKLIEGGTLTPRDLQFLAIEPFSGHPGPDPPTPHKSASIAAAVADLKKIHNLDVTKEFLRQLKREAGADAGFEPSGRVLHAKLIAYIRARGAASRDNATPGALTPDKQTLECRRLTAICERLETENKIRSGQYIEIAHVARSAVQLLAEICPMLDQKLVNEAPAHAVGRSVEEIRAINSAAVESAKTKFREFAALFQC